MRIFKIILTVIALSYASSFSLYADSITQQIDPSKSSSLPVTPKKKVYVLSCKKKKDSVCNKRKVELRKVINDYNLEVGDYYRSLRTQFGRKWETLEFKQLKSLKIELEKLKQRVQKTHDSAIKHISNIESLITQYGANTSSLNAAFSAYERANPDQLGSVSEDLKKTTQVYHEKLYREYVNGENYLKLPIWGLKEGPTGNNAPKTANTPTDTEAAQLASIIDQLRKNIVALTEKNGDLKIYHDAVVNHAENNTELVSAREKLEREIKSFQDAGGFLKKTEKQDQCKEKCKPDELKPGTVNVLGAIYGDRTQLTSIKRYNDLNKKSFNKDRCDAGAYFRLNCYYNVQSIPVCIFNGKSEGIPSTAALTATACTEKGGVVSTETRYGLRDEAAKFCKIKIDHKLICGGYNPAPYSYNRVVKVFYRCGKSGRIHVDSANDREIVYLDCLKKEARRKKSRFTGHKIVLPASAAAQRYMPKEQ